MTTLKRLNKNREAFVTIVANNCPHQFISIECCTPVKMNKRGNPLASSEVCKHTVQNVRLAGDYTKQVRRETGNAEFVAQPRAWGERLGNSPIIHHKGQVYLEYFCMKCIDLGYLIDGQPATTEQIRTIREFLPARRKTTNAGASTDIVRTVKIENILSIKMNGKTYKLD